MWHDNKGAGLVGREEGRNEIAIVVELEHHLKFPHQGDDFVDVGSDSAKNVTEVLGADDTFCGDI